MNPNTLGTAMGWSLTTDQYAGLLPTFLDAMRAADITTVNRAAMWCAQLGEESGGLQWMREIADGSEYEGRADLGNTQPGDGVRYAGRGPIQVTGRFNYRSFSAWAFQRGYVTTQGAFEANPFLLEQPKWGFLGAVWYWTTHGINDFADNGDVDGATLAINGGYHGIADRKARWTRCLQIGTALLPGDEDDMFSDDDRALLKDIQIQLRGPGLKGWPQLGQNDKGQNLTLVDAFAKVLGVLNTLSGVLGKIASKVGA